MEKLVTKWLAGVSRPAEGSSNPSFLLDQHRVKLRALPAAMGSLQQERSFHLLPLAAEHHFSKLGDELVSKWRLASHPFLRCLLISQSSHPPPLRKAV